MPKPLSGFVVIDLTHMLSGPFGTMLLADLGARTIKVEPPHGEGTRTLLAKDHKNSRYGMGAYFLTLNRNKESVVIDLKKAEGLSLFYDLIMHADVVVNNFGPGVPKRLGIDWDTLSKYNPRIITCSVTGFGETGPANARPAFDQIAQGIGGGMSITGQGQPTRAGLPIGDLGGGLFATIGILSAIIGRSQTGRGQHVDISMLDGQISLLNYMATMFLLNGENPKPLGNAHFVHVPYDTFPTKDRWIIIAVITDKAWAGVVDALDADDLRSPAFLTQPGRWANRDFINRRVGEIVADKSATYWLEELSRHGVPCGPVNDFEHALNDPQVRARNMIVEVALRQGGAVSMPGNPIKLSDFGPENYSPPPPLGFDTDAVLNGLLQRNHDEIARLRAEGIVA
jgi:CoA:oxalate CoA-transferase